MVSLLVVALVLPFGAHQAAASAQTTSPTGLLIPLYSYPGAAWTAVIQEKNAYPSIPVTVVINPDNGPGSWNSVYDTWISDLRADGINVLGYVPTYYGSASESSVESAIAAYKQEYFVNGIFLDQMPVVSGYQSYYSTLTGYANALGLPLVMGNAGSGIPSSYLGTVDVIIVYENSSTPSLSTLASVTMGQPKSNFALISYDVSLPGSSTVDMMANYAGYIYLTNAALPNPYTSVPSYFSALMSDLDSFASQPSVTVQTSILGGVSLSGLWLTITSGGSKVAEGFTPFTFTGIQGDQYTVNVFSYGSDTFSNWEGGGNSPSQTITLDTSTTLNAYFRGPYSLQVDSVLSTGANLGGMWTELWTGGNMVASGFTPTTYYGAADGQFTVCVDNYGSYTFSHWDDGLTDPCRTFGLDSDLVLTATYNS